LKSWRGSCRSRSMAWIEPGHGGEVLEGAAGGECLGHLVAEVLAPVDGLRRRGPDRFELLELTLR
jgi:hypothetical protein